MSLRCTNYGCLKTFEESSNSADSCHYHSQQPLIQDSLKTWPCCGQKSFSFDDFLSLQGCCHGFHNSCPRPPAPTPSLPCALPPDSPQPNQAVLPPSTSGPLTSLPTTVLSSVHSAMASFPPSVADPRCLNIGCLVKQSDWSTHPQCFHHKSEPCFHDTIQLWPCCGKKAGEMDYFLKIRGCAQGEHRWPENPNLSRCNVDFMDERDSVTVVVYARGSDPDRLMVRANEGRLQVRVTFAGGKYFERDFELFGVCWGSQADCEP